MCVRYTFLHPPPPPDADILPLLFMDFAEPGILHQLAVCVFHLVIVILFSLPTHKEELFKQYSPQREKDELLNRTNAFPLYIKHY